MTPPKLAETVKVVFELTLTVLTVNEPVVLPARIDTVDGTDALWLLLAIEMLSPPVGAGPLKVTVPVEFLPPVTEDGLNVKVTSCGGRIVREAVTELFPLDALRVETL